MAGTFRSGSICQQRLATAGQPGNGEDGIGSYRIVPARQPCRGIARIGQARTGLSRQPRRESKARERKEYVRQQGKGGQPPGRAGSEVVRIGSQAMADKATARPGLSGQQRMVEDSRGAVGWAALS